MKTNMNILASKIINLDKGEFRNRELERGSVIVGVDSENAKIVLQV